jgi:hypothetical protein
MKLKTKFTFLMIIAAVFVLQSCATLGLATKPNSSDSSLIYGHIDPARKGNAALTMMFSDWEAKKAFVDASIDDSELSMSEKIQIVSRMNDMPRAVVDWNTGVFALEVNEPGNYFLNEIAVTASSTYYEFALPDSSSDCISIGSGDVTYYGAVFMSILEDGSALLEPSMDITREEVLDLVEVLLEGKGWDEWIERERAEM